MSTNDRPIPPARKRGRPRSQRPGWFRPAGATAGAYTAYLNRSGSGRVFLGGGKAEPEPVDLDDRDAAADVGVKDDLPKPEED